MSGYARGWFVEGGKVVEVKNEKTWMSPRGAPERSSSEYFTDTCLERARDPEIGNGNTVYWTREAAERALLEMTDPVEAAFQDMKADVISEGEFVQRVGSKLVRKRLARG